MLKNKIRVINFDSKPKLKRYTELFPNVLRAGIFGPSGAGKTNLLLTVLVYMKPFENIYLCSKTGSQEKYGYFRDLVDDYNKKNQRKPIKFHTLTLPLQEQPEDLERNSVVIFDDVLTENQSTIANFFLRGRHRDISCFFLSQSFTKISKKSGIRENFNYLILFRQDLINLRQIHLEYVTDLTFEAFRTLCSQCFSEAYGFLVIDVENDVCRYKMKFEKCLYIEGERKRR